MTLDADGIRSAFIDYFTARGHTQVPSAGLIPHHPMAPMFTNAGMNQFLPYFLGEETPPYPRATTAQRCVRIRGKHDDVELIGRTTRHGSFFEMLGNFSFGDYFKRDAIHFAWELLTGPLGLDPARLWVTVHVSDDEAARIWAEEIGLPSERIVPLGAEDDENFWEMADTGPCGPCSEIFYDRGERYGADGGPAVGDEDRFLEVWNLVFMQFNRHADRSLLPLPAPNIDTGAGLERLLTVIEDAPSVWETSLMAPLIERAAVATGAQYGLDAEDDVALRVIVDHTRTMSFLISDGVFPSNEGRGYVLRRIIRRAVLRSQRFGPANLVLPSVVEGLVDQMGDAYPQLKRDAKLLETAIGHEEEAFRRTLRSGEALIEELLASGATELSGEAAFRLHDTFGFPIDLTVEVAAERGVTVDRDGFEVEMTSQRERARQARRQTGGDADFERWREVVDTFGPTSFVGYTTLEEEARVLTVLPRDAEAFASYEGEKAPEHAQLLDVVLDVTPFYAEGGGQVGDTGLLEASGISFRVLDTTVAAEGVTRHTGYVVQGELEPGAIVRAVVDAPRRAAIRRNHTGTHLLQAALRSVLGEHVKQQGSLVAPDRLRFDFSHFSALSDEEIVAVERFVNSEVLDDEAVLTVEMAKDDAEEKGAIAFFGDKYGDKVRVVEAGGVSVEFCGGTHVHATGMIGPFKVLSEASIGANTRRIFALTGEASLDHFHHGEAVLRDVATTLRTTPEELVEASARVIERQRELEEELRGLRGGQLRDVAQTLAAAASGGRVVARQDDLEPNELRDLALAVRDMEGIDAVALAGTPDGVKVSLVVAVRKGAGLDAKALAGDAARVVGGGGGGSPELATAGGRDVSAIDAAVARLGELLEIGAR